MLSQLGYSDVEMRKKKKEKKTVCTMDSESSVKIMFLVLFSKNLGSIRILV